MTSLNGPLSHTRSDKDLGSFSIWLKQDTSLQIRQATSLELGMRSIKTGLQIKLLVIQVLSQVEELKNNFAKLEGRPKSTAWKVDRKIIIAF